MTLFGGFDHIDLRVRDLGAARELYDALLPELGLAETREEPGEIEYAETVRVGSARRFFALHEDATHAPGNSRIAFSAATPAEVDRLAEVAKRSGARAVEGPEIPHSSEKYYAVFFEDASGNKLEICYRRPHDDAVTVPNVVTEETQADLRAT